MVATQIGPHGVSITDMESYVLPVGKLEQHMSQRFTTTVSIADLESYELRVGKVKQHMSQRSTTPVGIADLESYALRVGKDRRIMHWKSTKNKSEQNHLLLKSKLCKFYSAGACRNAMEGLQCPFAHSEFEMSTQPDLRKTRLCRDFEQGCCWAAAECLFAHGEEELRRPSRCTGAEQSLRDIIKMFGCP
eukprot:TRINITY_DN46695_c0_g1_i1.p1 TRINITY_DN46695_c0_g1~~TRINITY_DN46695_c0_g1_i1.p1  ORF type:complete len:190 (-),score=28.61 TRINITY_DN46695_c0_g1_i1:85-654(-)